MEPAIREKLKSKSKIEQDAEAVKPTVINDTLIREYIKEYNRENKIFDEDDKPIWEMENLTLSFKSKSATM